MRLRVTVRLGGRGRGAPVRGRGRIVVKWSRTEPSTDGAEDGGFGEGGGVGGAGRSGGGGGGIGADVRQ